MTRLETFLWKLQFPSILAEIAQDVEVVTNASKEVKDSEKLAQILKIILHLGGILNRDNYLSSTSGFKLESLALVSKLSNWYIESKLNYSIVDRNKREEQEHDGIAIFKERGGKQEGRPAYLLSRLQER